MSPLRDGINPQILLHFNFNIVFAPCSGRRRDKVEHRSTTISLFLSDYSTISKPFLYSNALMVKSFGQTLPFKNRDGQTKNKHQTFWPPGRGWSPSPTIFGMVTEEVRTILASLKRFHILPQIFCPQAAYSFAARRRWKYRENTPPPTLKPCNSGTVPLERIPKI